MNSKEQQITETCSIVTTEEVPFGVVKSWKFTKPRVQQLDFFVGKCNVCNTEATIVCEIRLLYCVCDGCFQSLFQAVQFTREEMKYTLEEQRKHFTQLQSEESTATTANAITLLNVTRKLKQMDLEASGPAESFFQ